MDEPGDVARLIVEMRGDSDAAARLWKLVYSELRRVAAGMMRRERPGHTLQPTAVVNQAYLRLFAEDNPTIQNRAHFFALAARAMREVLWDHARRKLAAKRGGNLQKRIELEDDLALTEEQSEEVIAIHQALERLQQLDVRQAQIVEMHYYAGNSVEEIALVFDMSQRTVKRELQSARLFFKKELEGTGISSP